MSIKINNEEIGECFYRVIFDGLSSEYKSMPLEKKEKILKAKVKYRVWIYILP